MVKSQPNALIRKSHEVSVEKRPSWTTFGNILWWLAVPPLIVAIYISIPAIFPAALKSPLFYQGEKVSCVALLLGSIPIFTVRKSGRTTIAITRYRLSALVVYLIAGYLALFVLAINVVGMLYGVWP